MICPATVVPGGYVSGDAKPRDFGGETRISVSDAGIGATVVQQCYGFGAAQNGGSSVGVLAVSGGQEGSSW